MTISHTSDDHTLPEVIELWLTSVSHPAQWEGKTKDGYHIYIRYRWGELAVGIGDTTEDALTGDRYELDIGGGLDGRMTHTAMMHHTKHILDWRHYLQD